MANKKPLVLSSGGVNELPAGDSVAQADVENLTTDLAAKAPIASPTFTGTVSGIDKTMVGLGNVDNTSDANKPISTATQTALDLKAPLAGPAFTGNVSFDTNTLYVDSVNDRVGIGTTSPSQGLHVTGRTAFFYSGSNAAPTTVGSGQVGLAVRVGGGDLSVVDMGLDSTYAWIQSRASDDFSTNYSLALNPNGGNLGIGVMYPSHRVHINGGAIASKSTVNAAPATSGTTQTGLALRLGGGDNAVIDMGLNSTDTWIQATDSSSLGTNYKLALNPNGGNVGVGVNSPTTPLEVNGDFGFTATGEIKCGMSSDTSGLKVDADFTGTTGRSNIIFRTAVDTGALTERVRIDGDGMKFNGDTAAANALDDYEEGTWTPVLTGSTGGTYTYSQQSGTYTKIGNLVTVSATIIWTGQTVAYTGNLQITGLPFASAGTYRWSGSIGGQIVGIHCNSTFTRLVAAVDPSVAYIFLAQVDDTQTSGTNYNIAPTVLTTGTLYNVTIQYQAS